MPGKVMLTVSAGPIQGQVFAFEEHDTLVFGREYDCHTQLPADDHTASRHHFILEINPPDARIRDLGSKNGTYVNGELVGRRESGQTADEAAKQRRREVDLKDRDRVQAGDTVFEVSVVRPVYCAICQDEIPAGEAPGGLQSAGPVCARCVAAKRPPRAVETVDATPRCQQCGQDVAAELGNGRRGDYVCNACRAKGRDDPVGAMMKQMLDAARPAVAAVPDQFPGYEVVRKLGEGGMGAVYEARRRSDGRRLAIKVLLPKVAVDEHARKTFRREAGVTRQLVHPHIVDFYDQGEVGNCFYFVIEFCEGGSVAGVMERHGGRLPLSDAGPMMLQALEGLAWAHHAEVEVELKDGSKRRARGVVHRDLKPENLLIANVQGRAVVKVADFGLAKAFQTSGLSGHTLSPGAVCGTPPFMPKDQVLGYRFSKPCTDVWAMGATFYNLLTGQYPKDFPPGVDFLAVILGGPVVPIRQRLPGIDARVAAVLDHALEDEPANRFPTALEFKTALADALQAVR